MAALASAQDLVINNELPPHVGAVLRVNAGPHESAHILKGAKETLAGQYAPLLVSTPILYGDLIGLSAYMHEQGYVLLTRAFLDPPTCEKPSRWEFRAMSLGEGFEIDAFDITRAAVEQGWTGRTPEQLQAWLLQEYPDMDMSRPTLRDRGMMYNRIWGGMLLRVSTEVLFAKPEILPLLPGAPKVAPGRTVKAMHGGLFGEDLSAVLGEQVARDTYLGSDVLGVMLKGSKGPDGRFVQACTGFGG